jgi:hypothetical protein
VILLSFYFTDSPELEKSVISLLNRFTHQKEELLVNIEKLQLLLSPE